MLESKNESASRIVILAAELQIVLASNRREVIRKLIGSLLAALRQNARYPESRDGSVAEVDANSQRIRRFDREARFALGRSRTRNSLTCGYPEQAVSRRASRCRG
jgi:hypothetical protein